MKALEENLSQTTAELKLTKGKLSTFEEEDKVLQEIKLTKLEKENKSLIEKQSATKLKVT